jgi:hypothetical protein
MTELLKGYDRELTGQAADADGPKPCPYWKFVAVERRESASEEARSYWLARLRGCKATVLAGSAIPGPDHAPAIEPDARRTLSAELVARIRAWARELGTPARSVYLAAHLTALSELTGMTEVVSGVVVNGRPEESMAERTLGLFLNTVPLRADLSGLSPSELIQEVFALEQDFLAHRRFAMARLRQDLGTAPFTILFNYTNFDGVGDLSDLHQVELGEWWSCDRNSFPVSVEIGKEMAFDRWRVSVRVDRAAVSPDTAGALASRIEAALWRFTGDSAAKVGNW